MHPKNRLSHHAYRIILGMGFEPMLSDRKSEVFDHLTNRADLGWESTTHYFYRTTSVSPSNFVLRLLTSANFLAISACTFAANTVAYAFPTFSTVSSSVFVSEVEILVTSNEIEIFKSALIGYSLLMIFFNSTATIVESLASSAVTTGSEFSSSFTFALKSISENLILLGKSARIADSSSLVLVLVPKESTLISTVIMLFSIFLFIFNYIFYFHHFLLIILNTHFSMQ